MSEIAYSIHPLATFEEGCLVLEPQEILKEGYSTHFLSSPLERPLAQWRALAKRTASDQEVFNFLLKEELAFQERKAGKIPSADRLLLKQLHISPTHILPAFKLLAKTQNLYCQGKQLVIDLFGYAEFYYEAHPLEGGQLKVQGRLHWSNRDIALDECEAVGPGKPLWFVHGLSLKLIRTELKWKSLQALKRSPLLLEGRAKQAFLEELDPEDPDLPQLKMKDGFAQAIVEECQPYPVLRLKDRWGACADLWMDYGQGDLVAFHDAHAGMQDPFFKRQLAMEASWEKDLLETDYIKKTVGSSHYYCPLDRVAKSLTFLLEVGWHIQDWQQRRVMKQTEVSLHFEDQHHLIAVKGHLSYDQHQADVSQVLGAFNRREHFVQLSPQAVGLLSLDAQLVALQDLGEEGEVVGQEIRVKKNRWGALAPLWEQGTRSPSLNELKKMVDMQESLPSPAFQGQLRPYQQQGVNWLSFLHQHHFHGLLADEMGLGKTVQVLAFLSRLSPQSPHLIVLPTSLLFNWRQEILHFLPTWSCLVHQGPARAKTTDELQEAQIILTSYATLRLDLPLLRTLSYTCVILDEAQMIKNARTQTAQAVCQLSAQFRLCLTGTPVENHLHELWSHFHFLMPDLLGSQESFEAHLQAAQADRRYLERMKRKVAPFFLRRRKQDVVAELPPLIHQVVWVEMPDEQRTLYEQLLAGFKSGLLKKVEKEGLSKHRLEILEAILRLRQVCCHPLLVSSLLEQSVFPSAKFDALLEDLATLVAEGHKVLVYSQFTSMLSLMAQTAKERNWSYGYLDGSTSNREEVVTRFQEDPSQLLFFISLKAGGVGLNLTAADYVYLYDPWWNEAVEEQAINRAHRLGRQGTVIAKRLVMAESIEEKMMKLKANKRVMIEDVLDAHTFSAPPSLTLEDIYELFS